jgi:hypothetical protein
VEEFAIQIGEALDELKSTVPQQTGSPTSQHRGRSRTS